MIDLVIIGQGYVGLPLARASTKAGLKVVGLDKSHRVVESLNMGVSHVDDISDKDLRQMVELGYEASTDPSVICSASHVIICVPTPLGAGGQPDLSSVTGATEDIAKHLQPGTTVILESTTYPGTTEDLILPALQAHGFRLDIDFWLAFSPERIDPGNKEFGLENTPKIVGGVSEASTAKAIDLYSKFVEQMVPVRGSKEAETAKLLENTYRHVNIALVNEMAKFCHELDIDLWDVIEAAKTKPFGFQAFYPGPGVGGHCIPIDPNYLSYEVERSLGYPFRFVELAGEINNSMPRYIVERTQSLLNSVKMPLNGSKILLLGVAYKANIADQRESPAVAIATLLMEKGASVEYHDPRIESWKLPSSIIQCVDSLDEAIHEANVVILLQNHAEYDIESIGQESRIFFDTRGVSGQQSGAHRL